MSASPRSSSAPLAELAHVDVSLGGSPVLVDVSFRLMPGEAWAVVGANGSGKTTFLRLLRGDIPPDRDDRGRRLYALDGPPQSSPIGLRHRFGLVTRADWDFWREQVPATSVLDAVCAGFFDTRLLHQPPDDSQRQRAMAIIDQTGLSAYADRRMAELSEGLLRAALVARALAPWPVLLALDEIFDGLDPDSRERVTRAIQAAMASGVALVATAHRPEDIPPGVIRAVVLHQGRIMAQGPLADLDYFQVPAPDTDPKSCPGSAPRPPASAASGPGGDVPPLFEIENADVYLDGRRILSEVSWRVDEGERWAVLGPNGAGKSTLLRLVMGELHPAQGGTVRRPGLTLEAGTDLRDIRTRIGFLSADLESAYPPRTTVRDVAASAFFAGVGLHAVPDAAQSGAVARRLRDLGLTDLTHRPLGSLSMGQRRLVFLARAVVHSPRLLILDEPFSGLDAAARLRAVSAVRHTTRDGAAVILVTHRPSDVVPEITRILHVTAGTVRADPT